MKEESWSQTDRHSRSSKVSDWRRREREVSFAAEGFGAPAAEINGGNLGTRTEKIGLASGLSD